MLHGAGGSTRNVIDGTGWAVVAQQEGFLSSLLDTLGARLPLDSFRVHVAGHSSGVAMACRFGPEYSERDAAIEPHRRSS